MQKTMLDTLAQLALEAGDIIMEHYAQESDARYKDDHSPVTDADIAANTHIVAGLLKAAPEVPIVSEEDRLPELAQGERFWLVDPLDGTRSFVRRNGEFTVNIALIENHLPIVGVLYSPVSRVLYVGQVGQGAYKQARNGERETIHARTVDKSTALTAMVSQSHAHEKTDQFLAKFTIAERVAASSSIKLGWLAEGKGDLYPRLGNTMEWDTAAGHAILSAAGGSIETLEGKPLLYGKPEFKNPYFVAWGQLK